MPLDNIDLYLYNIYKSFCESIFDKLSDFSCYDKLKDKKDNSYIESQTIVINNLIEEYEKNVKSEDEKVLQKTKMNKEI